MPSVGRGPLRDPPQPEEPDDVVDPDATRVPQHRVDHGAERLVARLDQPIGAPRWLRPVLAELVELVGRRPHRHPEGQHVLKRPRVRAVRVDADREVVHDAEGHARLQSGGLNAGQLVVQLPLQPPVEVDGRGVLGGERGDGRTCRVVQLDGPPVPVVAVLLGQRAPGGEVVEALPLPLPVGGVRQLTACRTRRLVDALQCRPLDLPRARLGRSARTPSRAPGRPLWPCATGWGCGCRRIRGSPRPAGTAG